MQRIVSLHFFRFCAQMGILGKDLTRLDGSLEGAGVGTDLTFQICSAYSEMVRSELNLPESAIP